MRDSIVSRRGSSLRHVVSLYRRCKPAARQSPGGLATQESLHIPETSAVIQLPCAQARPLRLFEVRRCGLGEVGARWQKRMNGIDGQEAGRECPALYQNPPVKWSGADHEHERSLHSARGSRPCQESNIAIVLQRSRTFMNV